VEFSESLDRMQVACIDAGLPGVTGFRHHVAQPRTFLEFSQALGLLESHHRGHGANHAQTVSHTQGDMREVVGRSAENANGVQIVGSPKHLVKGVVSGVTAISLAEPLATVCTQVSHRGDCAIRMLVPVELSPESATDHANTGLSTALRFRSQSSRQTGCGGQRRRVDQPLP